MPSLRIRNGDKTGEPTEIGERATLGRSHECDVQIKDVESSRVHAEVFVRDGEYRIRDLKSSNGTMVNGTKIDECVLEHGDLIEIGAIIVEFVDERSAETEAPDAGPHDEPAKAAPFPEPPGYEITERIGRDNLTETYRATDEAMDRPVAVDVIDQARCSDAEAVLANIKAAARLEHPATARIYAAGRHNDSVYFVREPATGESMWRLCGKLAPDEVIEAAAAAAGALAEAHGQSIVHGSLRPDRLVRTARAHTRLLGLGLPATEVGELSAEPDLQRHPNRIAYLPPEQFDAGPSQTGDIYSFGATLYHVICGREPFGAVSEAELAPKIASDSVIPVLQLRPKTPKPLAELIERMLSRDPAGRPASMVEVQAELEKLRDQAEPAEAAALLIEPPAAPAARPGGISAGGIIIAILTLLLLISVFLLSRIAGKWFMKAGDEAAPASYRPAARAECYVADAGGSTPMTSIPADASDAAATPIPPHV
ncbi:MAG: FHA domain-containing serine/threonine-protein kinase [Planctomycetota bacterium]